MVTNDGRADELRSAAREVFGFDELHPEQLEAMTALMAGRDVLAVLPTGSGKSAIYQVPAVLLDGVTLVVSPLIASQQDQIAGLADTGARRAVAIHSGQGVHQTEDTWSAVDGHDAEYVFLSPEQLANDGAERAWPGPGWRRPRSRSTPPCPTGSGDAAWSSGAIRSASPCCSTTTATARSPWRSSRNGTC